MANEITPTPLSPSERMEQIKREAEMRLLVLDHMRNGQQINSNDSIPDLQGNAIPQDTVRKIIDRVNMLVTTAQYHDVDARQLRLQAIKVVTQETLANRLGQERGVLQQRLEHGEIVTEEIRRVNDALGRKQALRERLLENLGKAVEPVSDTPAFLNAVKSAGAESHDDTPVLGVHVDAGMKSAILESETTSSTTEREDCSMAQRMWEIIHREYIDPSSQAHLIALLPANVKPGMNEGVISGISAEANSLEMVISNQVNRIDGRWGREIEEAFIDAIGDLAEATEPVEFLEYIDRYGGKLNAEVLKELGTKLASVRGSILSRTLDDPDAHPDMNHAVFQRYEKFRTLYANVSNRIEKGYTYPPDNAYQVVGAGKYLARFYQEYVETSLERTPKVAPMIDAVMKAVRKGYYSNINNATDDIVIFMCNTQHRVYLFENLTREELSGVGLSMETLAGFYTVEGDGEYPSVSSLADSLEEAVIPVVGEKAAVAIRRFMHENNFSVYKSLGLNNMDLDQFNLTVSQFLNSYFSDKNGRKPLTRTQKIKLGAMMYSYESVLADGPYKDRGSIQESIRKLRSPVEGNSQKLSESVETPDVALRRLVSEVGHNNEGLAQADVLQLLGALDLYIKKYRGLKTSLKNRFVKALEDDHAFRNGKRFFRGKFTNELRQFEKQGRLNPEILDQFVNTDAYDYLIDAYLYGLDQIRYSRPLQQGPPLRQRASSALSSGPKQTTPRYAASIADNDGPRPNTTHMLPETEEWLR